MSAKDPLHEFGRLIKQVKLQEYERGWREAMEALQRAAVTLYRQSGAASEAALAVSEGAAESEPSSPPSMNEPASEESGPEPATENVDSQGRFVTPKWALLKR